MVRTIIHNLSKIKIYLIPMGTYFAIQRVESSRKSRGDHIRAI